MQLAVKILVNYLEFECNKLFYFIYVFYFIIVYIFLIQNIMNKD